MVSKPSQSGPVYYLGPPSPFPRNPGFMSPGDSLQHLQIGQGQAKILPNFTGTPRAKRAVQRNDKRDMGARRRSFQSKFSKEMSSSTMRNIDKGWSDGIRTLVNIGESGDAEENLIFETQHELKKLIKQLELLQATLM